MANKHGKSVISPSLMLGLIVFLLCFIMGLIFWDWHHEKEVTRNIELHRAMGRLGRNQFSKDQFFLYNDQQSNSTQAQYSNTPYWGIKGRTINLQNQFQFRSPIPFGMIVSQISDKSVLNALQPGDIIARVDGYLLKDVPMFWALLKDKVRGSQLNMSIFRGGQQYELHFDP
ncbi:MAG: PDZ domain-containing protein [Candidatus Riflebacteria bacterium]|nr:PDZ domain-containing protein [Candidatus Riflebacteria bacterium]